MKLHIDLPPAGGEALRIESMSASATAVARDGAITCGVSGGPAQNDAAARLLALYLSEPGAWPRAWTMPYAGFIIDRDRREVHAGVDRLGIHALYWVSEPGALRLAARACECQSPGSPRARLSPAAIYAYVYFHHIPSPITVFEDVRKLRRAEALQADGRGNISVHAYHRESFVETGVQDQARLAAELMEIMRSAVRRALCGVGSPGAFLSGGLDSSTVSGLMAEALRPAPAHSFSIGFDAEGYDESVYARIAVRHFGLQGHEYYLTPDDVLATAPGLLGGLDEPFGNSSVVAAYHCAKFARSHGITGLLAGDGGDEIFSGNSRYAKQLTFERYHTLPASLRRRLVEPLVLTAGRRLPTSPFGKIARYIEQANVPLPDRLQSYNYLHRHSPKEVFTPAMLEQVDPGLPIRLWRNEYAAPDGAGTINRMLYLDWAFTLHDNDLVKVNAACREAGVAVTYPMLDSDLVDFACRLPGRLKMRHGELRGFYKRATRGFLPKEIIDKKKHGFGLPFGVWTRTHPGLARLAEQSLESLSSRGLFRAEFLRDTLHMHREGHAAYYGELVWILLALEIWLQRNAPYYGA